MSSTPPHSLEVLAESLTDEERQQIRERYRQERDKRLRSDGNSQYL
jgi:hypothetical protein